MCSCKEFKFPSNKHLDGRELTCVAFFQGIDTLVESDAVETSGKLQIDECIIDEEVVVVDNE